MLASATLPLLSMQASQKEQGYLMATRKKAAAPRPYGPGNVYSLTDEHRARLPEWRDKWIAIALRTRPQDAEDKRICADAVRGMYAAAKLKEPRVIFVPSPIVGAQAWCFSSVWIWLREHPEKHAALFGRVVTEAEIATGVALASEQASRIAHGLPLLPWRTPVAATYAATRAATGDATEAATRDATRDATSAATYAATYAATEAATSAATRAATWDATGDATSAATWDATRAATEAATYAATRDATSAATNDATEAATRAATEAATYAATRDATWDATRAATEAATSAATSNTNPIARIALASLEHWARGWNGGNHWAGWCSYLSFFREVAGLGLPQYDAWIHYERAAIHGCHRYMHRNFCLVSDFPEYVKRDERNAPHSASGPSIRYRDGWGAYYWRGTAVPREWIESPKTVDPRLALTHPQIEQRRALAEIIGWAKVLGSLDAKTIDRDSDPEIGELIEVQLPDAGGRDRFLRVRCGTGREFALPVPPTMRTALEANAWTYGIDAKEYRPEVRT